MIFEIALGAALQIPPPMPARAISPRETLPGKSVEIIDLDRKFTLFVPDSAKPNKEVILTVHFHSAIWHAIQEHLDRGLDGPLIAYYPGEGSSIYAQTFQDKARFSRWTRLVLDELAKRGWPANARISALDITSFSAGYGAVRELVQQPEPFKLMRRVILADSMYGSLTPEMPARIPLAEHVLVWKPLAEAALSGEKTFVVTFSDVPTPTYASSSEMASALVAAVDGKLSSVEAGTLEATKDPEFPLMQRFDKGGFHVWGYGGQNAQAHMTHARHLADIWMALFPPPLS